MEKNTNSEIESLRDSLEKAKKEIDFYKTALDTLPNPIFIKDEDLRFCFFNQSYKDFFHLSEGQYIGYSVNDLEYLSEMDRERYSEEDKRALLNTEEIHYEVNYPENGKLRESYYWSRGFNSNIGSKGVIGEIVDISREKQMERELAIYAQQMEMHSDEVFRHSLEDSLTGLYNRKALNESLPLLLSEWTASGLEIYIIMFDLDKFKDVNDTHGHDKGDEVLTKFSKVIRDNARKNDIAIRYGGDEFILFAPGITEEIAISTATNINNQFKEQVFFEETGHLSCSIGISKYNSKEGLKSSLRHTDNALYNAKESGRDCYKVFSPTTKS